MSDTITDLYLKYVEDLNKNLESDRYFRYMFEMIQASENVFSQQHQVLHKVVDERWLGTIEECLDPLSRIIEKPRRFIERNEEVVPVSLAKKITADSVRHLSMNTQFIVCADEDNIQPTHILNVSVDESFNLYENRFIYHLIQRLVTFVDKRTDIIFWSSGDETQNLLRLESNIDDAYERIEYKLEMKIKNLQSTAESDADNMEVFMRIDRVRRLVMALKHSSFCEIMAGCEKVKSPIQRTNLLTKDPDYRKCYQLWQFLESYDEVGYSIDVQESALEFDEEYQIQMFTNLINNYTVFKSITEADTRDLEDVGTTRRKVVKPRFVKEIEEEIVTDFDIHEAEVRRVFVEEVTQGQLDAEAALEAEKESKAEVEQALRDAEAGAHHSLIQAEYAMSAKAEAEALTKEAQERVKELELILEKERTEKENALLIIQEKDELLLAKDEQLGTDAVGFMNQLEEQRVYFEERIEELNSEHEMKLNDLRDEYEETVENTEIQFMDKMNSLEQETAGEIEAIQIRAEDKLNKSLEEFEDKLAKQTAQQEAAIAENSAMYEQALTQQREEFESSYEEQKDLFAAEISKQKDEYEQKLIDKQTECNIALETTQQKAYAALAQQRADSDEALRTEIETAGKKYYDLEVKSHDEYEKLRIEKDEELASVRREAGETLDRERAEAEERYDALRRESSEKYKALKTKSAEELTTTKKNAQAKLVTTKEKAQNTEAELRAKIAKLTESNKFLSAEQKRMTQQLKEEKKARNTAEVKAASEKMLREAAESKVTAKTLGEFIHALRLENKAKKMK